MLLILSFFFGIPSILADSLSPPSVLIQEIVDLPEGQEIPNWILKIFDSRTIAENIVFRIYSHYSDQMPDGEKLKIPSEDFELFTFFKGQDSKAISEYGFQNIHENGKHGLWTPNVPMKQEARVELEGKFARLSFLELSKKQILPKYGILQINTDVHLGYRATAKGYGEIGAKLKSSVLKRTTWTSSDSGSSIARDIQTFYTNEQVIDTTYAPAYIEIQVWGALDASDIEYLVVPENYTVELIESLKSFGLPIRSYQISKFNGREQVTALEYLYEGDSTRVRNFDPINHCKNLFSTMSLNP